VRDEFLDDDKYADDVRKAGVTKKVSTLEGRIEPPEKRKKKQQRGQRADICGPKPPKFHVRGLKRKWDGKDEYYTSSSSSSSSRLTSSGEEDMEEENDDEVFWEERPAATASSFRTKSPTEKKKKRKKRGLSL